jgi:hypothetical protein
VVGRLEQGSDVVGAENGGPRGLHYIGEGVVNANLLPPT